MGSGWGWFSGAILVIGLVLLIVLAVLVVGGGVHRDGPASGGPPRDGLDQARRLLDERYARGEISTEEYQQRSRVLGDGR